MPYWFDGNNLIGQSAEAARKDRSARRDFLLLLSRYATSRGGQFIVFFDGEDPNRMIPPRRVRVRYSAPASTDDAILRLLSGSSKPHEVTVVTNDHELANRCRDADARIMNWQEFTARMKPCPVPSRRNSRMDEGIDIEDWAQYFGLDPNDLG